MAKVVRIILLHIVSFILSVWGDLESIFIRAENDQIPVKLILEVFKR